VSIGIQMVLPFPYGLFLAVSLGPGFIIAGVIFVIRDKKPPNISKKSSDQTKFCKKCGQELSFEFCKKCGTKSKL